MTATRTRRPSATSEIAARDRLRPGAVAHFQLHDVLLGVASTEYPVIAAGQVVGRRCKYTLARAGACESPG